MQRISPATLLIQLTALSLLIAQAQAGTVRLAWRDPNPPGRAAGYNVYRSAQSEGGFAALNAQPVAAPAFVDPQARSGSTYRYKVTAVDSQGEESPFSETVSATVGAQALLALSLQQAGSFVAGSPASYRVTVLNRGNAPTRSLVTVTLSLPVGLSYLSAHGDLWDCTLEDRLLTCERDAGIDPNQPASFLVELWIESEVRSGFVDALVWTGGEEVRARDEVSVEPDVIHALYFPYHESSARQFTGVAFSNNSDQPAELELSAFDPQGEAMALPDNPSRMVLDPGAQRAEVGLGLFGSDSSQTAAGWLELRARNPQVQGFFLFGDFDLERLDGAPSVRRLFSKLYFTRAADHRQLLDGLPVRSRLRILNPAPAPARVLLRLHPEGDAGTNLQEVVRDIPSRGFLDEPVGEMFGLASTRLSAYVEVDVLEGDGVIGLLRIELGQQSAVAGLLPVQPGPERLYAAHFASGPGIFTRLSLLNASADRREVMLKVTSQDGSLLAEPLQLSLEGGRLIEGKMADLFGFDASSLTQGALQVESDGPGLGGDILIGAPGSLRFAAASLLQDAPVMEAAFGHLVNSQDFFTGLALFNPGPEVAAVDLAVRDAQGNLVGKVSFELPAGHRITRLIDEWVPSSAGQSGGSVEILSSAPLVALQMFGDRQSRALSTIPPLK